MPDARWCRCASAAARARRSGWKGYELMNVLHKTSETTGETPAPPSAPLPAPVPERTVRLVVGEDGICVLTFDRPGSSANIFDLRTLEELAQELEFIERQTELKGLIF